MTVENAIVRIYNAAGTIVGTGFLVDAEHVMTCAHVVNSAVGCDPEAAGQPTDPITLDFPLLARAKGHTFSAQVTDWYVPEGETSPADIAVLKVTDVPASIGPITFARTIDDQWGQPTQSVGFPRGRDDGVWWSGTVRKTQARGWLQVDAALDTQYFVEQGFSGAPVWVGDDRVIGMVVRAELNEEVRVAYLIPAPTLAPTVPTATRELPVSESPVPDEKPRRPLTKLKMVIGAGVVITVLVLVTAVALRERLNTSSSSDVIAFALQRGTNQDICVISVDGGKPDCLTSGNGTNTEAAWSPDGRQIAFQTDRDGNAEIYVMKADGSKQENISDRDAEDTNPAWSPDGSQIAFVSDRDANLEIYVMAADGSNPVNLSQNPWADDKNPTWSPDGSQIAFISGLEDSAGEICTVSTTGHGRLYRITSSYESTEDFPAWSPDGRQIAFVSTRDGNQEIYVMDYEAYVATRDDSHLQRLTDSPAKDYCPEWSPDGQQIAFLSEELDGPVEIWLMNANGTEPRRLTIPTDGVINNESCPSWHP